MRVFEITISKLNKDSKWAFSTVRNPHRYISWLINKSVDPSSVASTYVDNPDERSGNSYVLSFALDGKAEEMFSALSYREKLDLINRLCKEDKA